VVSAAWYTGFIALTGLERIAELIVGRRNLAWSLEQGGVEHGRGHWPVMVMLHTGLLVGCLIEVWWLQPVFSPVLGGSMLALALGCQALRWWCIRSLGPRWNPRVVVIPGLLPVRTGPYRWLRHPNYVAVVLEGVALPGIHGAWCTAIAFTVLNAILLSVRVRCENAALATLPPPETQ
jgi:methyltransferase